MGQHLIPIVAQRHDQRLIDVTAAIPKVFVADAHCRGKFLHLIKRQIADADGLIDIVLNSGCGLWFPCGAGFPAFDQLLQ